MGCWQKDLKNPPVEEPTLGIGPPGQCLVRQMAGLSLSERCGNLESFKQCTAKKIPGETLTGEMWFRVININPNTAVCVQLNWDNLGIHDKFEIKLISQNCSLLSFKTIRQDNWIASQLMNAWKNSAPCFWPEVKIHNYWWALIDSSAGFTSFYLCKNDNTQLNLL